MTENEYNSKLEALEREQIKLNRKIRALNREYLNSLNDEYAHFLKKKVVITYTEFGYDRFGKRRQKTITCYWNGFKCKEGWFFPMLRRVKRDGTMSSKSIPTEFIVYEIISMVEAE